MNKRINIPVLFMVLAVLLFSINLCLADNAYHLGVVAVSDSFQSHSQSIISDTDTAFIEFCTPELINGHVCDSLINGRFNSKGYESRSTGFRILTLLAAILCLLEMAYCHLNFGVVLSKEAGISHIILCYIHSKDGKK